ncbi:hypothetical protein L917_03827, partial [Phytophthora nicotianae]
MVTVRVTVADLPRAARNLSNKLRVLPGLRASTMTLPSCSAQAISVS